MEPRSGAWVRLKGRKARICANAMTYRGQAWVAGLVIAAVALISGAESSANTLDDAAIGRAGELVGFDRLVGMARNRTVELAREGFLEFKADLIRDFDYLDLVDAPWPVWEKEYVECHREVFDAVVSERRRAGIELWLGGEANIRDLLEFADSPVGQEFFRHARAMQAGLDEAAWLKGLDEARRHEIAVFLASPAGTALRTPPPGRANAMLEGLPEKIMEQCVMDDETRGLLRGLGK